MIYPKKIQILDGESGKPLAETETGSRIFSRRSTARMVKLAKSAKDEGGYIALGRAVYNEVTAQDKRSPQYTQN